MRYLNRLVCAMAIAVAAGAMMSTTFAQQGSVITGGGKSSGSLSGTGGLAGGGQGGIGGGTGSLGGTALTQMEQAPSITAPGATGGGGTGGSQDPIFSRTAANPLYQGMDANARSNAAPGGFGQVLMPTSAGNATGGRTGTGARTTGGTLGGRTGGLNTGTEFGTIISTPIQISYAAVPRFSAPPIAAPQLQADLSGMIGRSTMIANPAGVQVLTQGQTVTLRGVAKDAEEARLIVGMVRMTPGVREVKNELTFPRQ